MEHDPQTYYPDVAPRPKTGAAEWRQDGRYEMTAPPPAQRPAPTTATILA